MSKTIIKNTNQFGKRPHYELKELQTWSENTLIEYIIFTMQRKGITEFSTTLFPGYFGCRYDRPEGWHLLFWPFLGGYRHTYEWTRVFLKNGELLFKFEERISKYQYDLFEDTFLEKIFSSPVGRTVGERYCPKIITHYDADEFFDMFPHLPIKDIQSKLWSKQRYLADVASSLELCNPQREAAEAARRPKMTLEQAMALADAPILKVRSMQEIKDECFGPKKTKFSLRLLCIFLVSVVVSIPVGIFLHNNQYQVEPQFGFSWLVATLILFGMWFGISLLIDLFEHHSRVYIKR
ncbi:MAG: hypothetical protein IJX60_03415 [Paludibacteraceae bacterium]|nr:hypothetical protein [Paludibacteraceae bacterium]